MGEPLDGKALAAQVRSEVADAIARSRGDGPPPGLAVVLVGDDPASAVYVKNKGIVAKKCGLESFQHTLPASTTEDELLRLVDCLNNDPAVHGILVQCPLPDHISEDRVLDTIDPAKDVDGLHPVNQGLLAAGRPHFVPCTPLGVLSMLLRHGVETSGKHAVILGRSKLVGRPLSLLLSRKGPGGDATVTVAHSKTEDLDWITRSADILVCAMGIPEFISPDMIKHNSVVIDVGINRLEDGSLCGDIEYVSCLAVSSLCTPVPGGVGPMTIAMLMQNTAQAWAEQVGHSWPAPWAVASGALTNAAA